MSKVFLVDSQRQPLDPIHPGWARRLLSSGQAAVLRRYPFTLILKKSVEEPDIQPHSRGRQQLRIKLDTGTGKAHRNDGYTYQTGKTSLPVGSFLSSPA